MQNIVDIPGAAPDVLAKINDFVPYGEMMPGVVIIHDVTDFSVLWMSKRGIAALGSTLAELQALRKDYYDRFFNIEDMADFLPKIKNLMLSRDADETFTFFQQVKFAERKDWVWHICAVRIFHFDAMDNPSLVLTTAVPIDRMQHIVHKAERLMGENTFIKRHDQRFGLLGKREKEVLRQVALGRSSIEIASELFIAVDTVNTHRKNIKQKLGISNTYEFSQYASAFNLI